MESQGPTLGLTVTNIGDGSSLKTDTRTCRRSYRDGAGLASDTGSRVPNQWTRYKRPPRTVSTDSGKSMAGRGGPSTERSSLPINISSSLMPRGAASVFAIVRTDYAMGNGRTL